MRREKTLLLAALGLLALLLPPAAGQGITGLAVHDDGHIRRHPHRPIRPAIRIVKHHVDVTIEAGVARTTVRQTFRNPSRCILEGSYVFPVPDGASLTDFTMVMNGKVVHGEVLEKDKARRIYEDIVRKMRDPALLEYVGQSLFRARVYPIGSGDVDISLSYIQHLPSEAGVTEYRYPLKTQAFSRMPVDSLAVRATIKSGVAIKSVFSSSHRIDKVRKSDHEMSVSFEGKQALATRDFHLFYTLSDREFGLHLLSEKAGADGGFFMMTLAPRQSFDDEEIAPKDVVFVVDTSGSMQEDEKMEQAKKALMHGLRGLNRNDRFNIVGFSTEARVYSETLIERTDDSVAAALGWVGRLRAAGGTNIHDALYEGISRIPDSDRVKIVVFLTDGLPTVGETAIPAILKTAAQANGKKARLFAFGVGFDVNTQLLDTLAQQNRGARDYVTPGQNMELKLSSFFDKIAYPVLSDLEVKVDGLEILEVYPKTLPDLFKGTELVVFGRYEGDGNKAIRLKGRIGDEVKEFVYEGRFAAESQGRDFIPVLWAKRKVGYLWDQIRLKGRNAELEKEIVRLGKKYAIATPYTSFLVTEDEVQARRRDRGRRDRRPAPPHRRRRYDDFWRAGGAPVQPEREAPADGAPSAPAGSGSFASSSGRGAVRESLEAKKLQEGLQRDTDVVSGLKAEVDTDGNIYFLRADGKRATQKKVVQHLFGRTFRLRQGVWIDVALDAVPDAERQKKLERIEAFSPAYFELVKQIPEIARYLARLPQLMISIAGRYVWITAPAPEESSAAPQQEKPAAPAKEVRESR